MDISDLALKTIARQHAEIERLTKDRDEYAQAASVEAGLRREFLARAEKAEAEIGRLNTALCASESLKHGYFDEIDRLRAALKECADDLEASVNAEYRDTLDYPSQKLKYDRDMQPVMSARKLLNQQLGADPQKPSEK